MLVVLVARPPTNRRPIPSGFSGGFSMTEIEARPALPRLNEPAPAFEAVTTQGTLTLADFEGRWLILFSHPADFTPVCTTEFLAFAEIFPELQKRGTDLLGLSIDSVFSHIAWVRNIEEKTGVRIPFPVIADLNKEVATAYGMLMPGESKTETSRCVFIIDPKGILRAMIYYPLSLGRNMAEILRVIDALQTADQHGVAMPANWKPGDKVIVPAPRTQEGAEERVKAGHDCVDWYLCKKDL
jgi:peroxiredoxin 2/4